MEHEFVVVDGININATHLLGMKPEDAVQELLAQDQILGKDEAEKKAWIGKALPFAKSELAKREETRKAEAKKEQERKAAAEKSATSGTVPVVNNTDVGTDAKDNKSK